MLKRFFNWTKTPPPPEQFPYVVYAPSPSSLVAMKLINKDLTSDAIQVLIARHENGPLKRDYAGVVQPGSFNYVKIPQATSRSDAVAQARNLGLKYEPIKTVLSRNKQNRLDFEAGAEELRRTYSNIDRIINNLQPRPL